MGDAGLVGEQVAAAGAHEVVHRDVWDVVIGPDNDLETICKREAADVARHPRGDGRITCRHARDEKLEFRHESLAEQRD